MLQDVEAALQTVPESVTQQLQQLQARCVLQLEELTDLVRGPLSSLERKVLCSHKDLCHVLQHACNAVP